MHNTQTVFPGAVDPRLFFSDVSLQHANILQGYSELIETKQYQAASQYLYDNVETPNVNMDYNGAYLWNTFENRVAAIETYATAMEPTTARVHYSPDIPTDLLKGMTWIA